MIKKSFQLHGIFSKASCIRYDTSSFLAVNPAGILGSFGLVNYSSCIYNNSATATNTNVTTATSTTTAVLRNNSLTKHCTAGYASNVPTLIGRDFLTLKDFNADEIKTLLWTAMDLKERIKRSGEIYEPLKGKSMAMIFQKRSTRTRISTETGMSALGGKALFLSPDDIHIGVNESVTDSARVLSRFCDIILARVYGQEILEGLSAEATIPVISGLSDLYHPLQILADFMTLQEEFGHLAGLKLAWVGDGNNIVHSLMMGCTKLGIDLSIATPQGYECDPVVATHAAQLATQNKTSLKFTTEPMEATYMADAILTDTWVSMGQEEEKAKRLADFSGYQVNQKMMDNAGANAVFMHCLPRKQEEVTDDVFYGKRSIVWDEAENRKWTVMAVMLHLLKNHVHKIAEPQFGFPAKS